MSVLKFLFPLDPIDGYELNPIPIDILLGTSKIPTEETYHDHAINNTESITIGTNRKEILIDYKQDLLGNSRDMEN